MAATNGANGHAPSAIVSVDEFLKTNFDYLILGGGTAGCCIAARLTENPDVTVGVIEAGKYKIGDPLIDTPAAFLQMFENPEYDWCLYTAPQKRNHNKVHHMPRGKALGGSSAINYMMYVRGSLQDYDDWAALAKDEGWSAKHMAEYMRKHQTLEPIDAAVTDRSTFPFVGEFHGTSGPVRTSFNDNKLQIEDDFIKACDDVAGFTKKPRDPWSGDHIGFFNTLGAIVRSGPNKGKRSYAARGYIEANKERPNLKILCDALVNKINLEGNKAIGANFTVNGREYDVSAKREVVVCGGSVKSPQILELSGIGDPDVLKSAGIECKIENRGVGANFQDHSMSVIVQSVKPGVITLDTLHQVPEAMQGAMKQYMETGGGPIASVASMQGFFPFKKVASAEELKSVVQSIRDIKPTSEFHKQQLEQVIAHLESDISANLQLVMVPATANLDDGVEHQAKIFPPRPADKPAGLSVAMCLQYPVSRGYIHIDSSDPTKPPVIQPNYLEHTADAAVIAAGLRFIENATKDKHVVDSMAERIFPPASWNLQDLQQGIKAVHDVIVGEYHPCGSVAMGDALDSRLRVKGAQNLRVADASVFPNNVSGNIVSSVYAVAEKAADMIKEDWDFAALKAAK